MNGNSRATVAEMSRFLSTAAVAASLLVFVFGGPAHAQQSPQPGTQTLPAAVASNSAEASATKTFEGRQWLMGINATVSTDDGTPVINVRGGQGGRAAGGARPIGHVAIAEGISIKEGAIDFEMKSSQRNRVGHNYIGVIFRVQDHLHYEVVYFRFCPGSLAGIQYASVSDGTDPWQQFQQPQFTRYGVFSDKNWIKIHIELRGDRMLLYIDQCDYARIGRGPPFRRIPCRIGRLLGVSQRRAKGCSVICTLRPVRCPALSPRRAISASCQRHRHR